MRKIAAVLATTGAAVVLVAAPAQAGRHHQSPPSDCADVAVISEYDGFDCDYVEPEFGQP
jgi:hypothetical protein